MKRKKFKLPENPELMTSTGNDLPGLTGFRGLAALWVFLLHAFTSAGTPDSVPTPIAWLFSMGWTGVDIFFGLSAFLLTLPYLRADQEAKSLPDTRQYFRKRFARILPAYYLQCLILAGVFYWGFSKAVFWYEPTALGWLAHGALWINALPLVPAYVSPWWTLPVELGFYLLLPLLAKCLTDKRWWWLLIGVVLSLAYRYVLMHADLSRAEEIFWVDHLPGRLFQFLIGMLAAFFFMKWRAFGFFQSIRARNILLFLAGSALISLPAMGWIDGATYNGSPSAHPVLQFWHLFASLLIAIILIMLALGNNFVSRILNAAPLQWLGKISFGLYLWHFPVMLVLRENMGGMSEIRLDFLSYLIFSFLISATLAFLSWHWLEAPILKRVSARAEYVSKRNRDRA